MKHMKSKTMILLFCCFAAGPQGQRNKPDEAVQTQGLVKQWNFVPVYALERNARNVPGIKEETPPPARLVDWPGTPWPMLRGGHPTESKTNLLVRQQLPGKEMSLEMWILYHVNQPVGALAGAIEPSLSSDNGWLVSICGNQIDFSLKSAGKKSSGTATVISVLKPKPWKQWIYHVVATYDGSEMKLYVNGDLASSSREESGAILYAPDADLSVYGYFEKEPYMQLGNLVRELKLYSRALNADEIKARLAYYRQAADEGNALVESVHFTMGPILQNITGNSVTIVWETDRPSAGTVRYNAQLPLTEHVEFNQKERIHKVGLKGLEESKAYFYEVTDAAEGGAALSSGTLTFQTAVRATDAFSFVLIGDTETRPFINDRLAKMVWGERPNFGVILGDLTDGGNKDNKWQYNYELFAGMGQLFSRVNFFMVPGNAERDMYWYRRYFVQPGEANYYKFSYGNADFWALNSNRPDIPIAPGTPMYNWLDKELAASRAQWKFVCLHYAPFSSDENDYGDSWKGISEYGDSLVRGPIPLYEKYGVDMVFYGHLHSYERSWPLRDGKPVGGNGVVYVMSGGGGGDLEDFAPTRTWFANSLFRGRHYCVVSIHGGDLQFKVFDLEGRMRDVFTLKKQAAT